ncbi:reverse transcriptase-like protein [Meiothermus granaticius]|uniref:Uncharacterized protein n=1 Tax=Meiothermus granaticius NBRC 107808 TaxID=1227551 RepID=A0A399FA43_9DEIN|nr:reverse transcriptase-like protein [Meiothermus granaticius]MCL6527341.1 reverse transcriptase-like protein [Thermaceae bacterium]RIH93464.1 hypothetical protein Mgrana_00518 [Meiothermus granaticius NBRC 107808]GEM85957.1 hypothetical protein MGR01S_05820 [Meiothermus granaticius NBRC 107808]
MGAVAIYVEGLVKEGRTGWAFLAPEVGHSDHGWIEGGWDLLGQYRGVLEGLRWAEKVGYTNVLIHSSDPVFVVQMLDGLGAEQTELQAPWWQVKEVEAYFQRVVYFTVRAEENLAAGALGRLLN